MRDRPAWLHGAMLAVGLILSASMPATMARASEVPVVSGMSYGVHHDRVRVILDVSSEPGFAAFTLSDPDRLVIDLPELEWEIPAEAQEGPAPYVKAIRYGLFRRDRARIVMDLTRPVHVERIFTQPPRGNEPARLVVDLSPASRDAFDARAGWPEKARWQEDTPFDAVGSESDIVVAIDPGHGGIDPGATGGRLVEKDIVLAFSKVLAAELEARPGIAPFLIREKDEFVPLSQRVARAHAAGANLLISVHADAVESGIANGLSVYTLSDKGSDDAAEALAARENRADVIAGADLGGETDDLTRLLVELAQRGTQVESIKLAQAVVGSLGEGLELLRSRPMRQANFRVLKAPDLPSILLELGFLNSRRDQKRLSDPEWRKTAARAVADGLERYAETASPGFLRSK